MSLPTRRLTVTLAEHDLLKPGLDLLANGLATAKLGSFPHRHPWHRIDFAASDVYRDQEFDAEMSARIISARRKLWAQTQSRKVYLDALELAALAFALRLSRSKKLVDVTETVSTEMELLASKLENYRKCAKRSAAVKIGTPAYRSIAGRWRRNVAWLQYHTLYTKVPNNLERGRARRWQEQRQQATQAIKAALTQKFYEIPGDKHMDRIVTLFTTSLRRCRYRVGLIGVLLAQPDHTDFIVGFVVKRLELNRLPGAPVPVWQEICDRADKIREYQQRVRGGVVTPSQTDQDKTTMAELAPQGAEPPKVKASRPYTHNRVPLTLDVLRDTMASRLYETVTVHFNFTREVCEQAQFQIKYGHLEQYRVVTTSTSLNGLIKEFGPVDSADDAPTLISNHSDWILGVLVALRLSPASMYEVVGAIYARAMRMDKDARHDELLARISSGSQSESISA